MLPLFCRAVNITNFTFTLISKSVLIINFTLSFEISDISGIQFYFFFGFAVILIVLDAVDGNFFEF